MKYALAVIQAEIGKVGMDSVVSVAVLLAIIGGVWRLSSLLTEIKLDLKRLKSTPSRLGHIENHLLQFEEDVNILFGAVRTGAEPGRLAELTRRSRFRPFKGEDEDA